MVNLEAIQPHRPVPAVRYLLPKPDRDGRTVIELTPLEFLDRLAVLIPPPRKHRHRYHGVLAPNSVLRPVVSARAGLPIDVPGPNPVAQASAPRAPEPRLTVRATALWAFLISRIYEALPLACPQCGNELTLIAFITEPASVARILNYFELPAIPPPLAPARGPPFDDAEQAPRLRP